MIAIERSHLEKLPKILNPSVNKSCKHCNLQMGLEHSSLYLGSAFPILRGNEMMNELIFVQGFEERQCLKCLCVLTSNFTSAESPLRGENEGDSGRNDTKHFCLLLPKPAGLRAEGESACGWQCCSGVTFAGPK